MATSFSSILITGGSTGLGRALALHYAAPGVTLSLTGRRIEPLEETAAAVRAKGAEVIIGQLDVTDADAMTAFIQEVDGKAPLDLVIANAGIGSGGRALDKLAPIHQATWATNIDGVGNTVFPAIDCMRKRQKGHIAIMSSLSSFIVFPETGAYASSKIAVRFFGEALRSLLWRKGIKVSVICPGFVETPLTDQNDFTMPMLMKSEKAAEIMARGIAKGKGRIIFPWTLYLIIRLFNLLPYPLRDRIQRLR